MNTHTAFIRPMAILLGILTLPSITAADDFQPTTQAYAFIGGRVILEPGKTIDGATVLTRAGRIEAVGTDLPIPFDALRIDATGLTVHAGFIDAGNSFGYDANARPTSDNDDANLDVAAKAYAASPEADRHFLTPQFRTARALTTDEDTWEKWRLNGFTVRAIKPAGPVLAGQSALVTYRGRPILDSVLRERLAMQVDFETNGRQYPTTLMGAIARFRQALADADHYRKRENFAANKGIASLMPPSDPAWTELQPVLDGILPVAIRAQSEDEILRALAVADETKVRLIIDGGREAWKLRDKLAKRSIPILLSADFPEKPKPAGKTPASQESSDSDTPQEEQEDDQPEATPDALPDPESIDRPVRLVKDEQRRWQEDFQGIARLLEAELNVGLSFDKVQPEKFNAKIEILTKEAGLDHDKILSLMTTRAAEALGVHDQLGSIAPGKRAHIVLRDKPCDQKDSIVRYVLIEDRLFEYPGDKPKPKNKSRDEKKDDVAKEKEDDVAKEEKPRPKNAEIHVEIDSDRTPMRKVGGNVLIRGVHLLSVGPQGNRSDTDIRIKNGKIVEIASQLSPDDGASVIDARGWFAMPGIIDSHSHMAIAGGINEASLSVTPEVRIRDVINSKDVTIYRALAGGVTTARILHGSANTIGGQDAVIKLRYGDTAPAMLIANASRGVKFALGENVTRNQSRFPNTRLGVEAVLTRAFAEADAYRKQFEQFKNRPSTADSLPPRRDLRLEALANVLDGEIAIHCHCYRADEILMLLAVADQFNIKIRSLQHGLEAYKIAPEVARHGCSVSTFSDWWAYKWEAYDATPYNTALLREAGVHVCLKSDSPNVVRTMNQEAAKLLRYGGLTPDQALETITIIPARQLNLDARIGSIEIGKDADIALFNGHPLNTYARCELTLVDGEIFFQRRDSEGAAERVLAPGTNLDSVSRIPTTPLELPPANPDEVAQAFDINKSQDNRYALVGGDIYTVTGDVIHDGTLIIEDGKILEIKSDATGINDSQTTVVDLQGLRVYPGFIDAGCKVGLAEVGSARETLDFHETGPFQPDLRAAAAIHPDSALIPVTRAGGVTTVVTMPTGGVVSGQSALVQLDGWVPGEMVLVDPLALHVRFPAPPREERSDRKPFDGRGRFAELRDRRILEIQSLVRLARHYDQAQQQAKARKAAPPPTDPRLESLLPYIRKEKPLVIHADSTEDIIEAVRLAEKLNLRLILQGARDAWKLTTVLKDREIPVIAGPILTLPTQRHDPYDAAFTNLARLHAAGIPFCIQTDDTSNSRNLPLHAAIAVAYGLPPEEGLKAVTIYPAKILGVEDRLGSIEEGKIANLILCDGDPLQCATQIKHLFINGNPIPPTSKHTELYKRFRERLNEQ